MRYVKLMEVFELFMAKNDTAAYQIKYKKEVHILYEGKKHTNYVQEFKDLNLLKSINYLC